MHLVDIGTESCVRLHDVDGDGADDIIIGLALGKDVTSMLTEASMEEFCKKNGKYHYVTLDCMYGPIDRKSM